VEHRRKYDGWKLLVLVISSTLMAEVLSGSTTWTRLQYLPTQFLLYGSAAVIIRELARRMNAGWSTIILFGVAFGFILEGLTLQSVFNPNFLGNNISLGRALDINWVWAMYMPAGFHAFCSITGPILLTELFFDKDRTRRWARPVIFYITCFIFILITTGFHFIFINLTKFSAPSYLLLTACIPIFFSIIMGVRSAPNKFSEATGETSKLAAGLTFLITCITGALWCAGFVLIFTPDKPAPWLLLVGGPVVLLIYFLLITRLSFFAVNSNMKRLAVTAGILLSGWLFGYFATIANATDHLVQLLLLIPIVIIIFVLYRKIDKRDS
jgi:hypothetical protein